MQCLLQLIMWLGYESIIAPWFNDELQSKWILMHPYPITLPDAVLDE